MLHITAAATIHKRPATALRVATSRDRVGRGAERPGACGGAFWRGRFVGGGHGAPERPGVDQENIMTANMITSAKPTRAAARIAKLEPELGPLVIDDFLPANVLDALFAPQAKFDLAVRTHHALADHVGRGFQFVAVGAGNVQHRVVGCRPIEFADVQVFKFQAGHRVVADARGLSPGVSRRSLGVRQQIQIDLHGLRRRGQQIGAGRRRGALDRGNDEGHAALRALALHAHVRFFALQQMPLGA